MSITACLAMACSFFFSAKLIARFRRYTRCLRVTRRLSKQCLEEFMSLFFTVFPRKEDQKPKTYHILPIPAVLKRRSKLLAIS